MEQIWIAEEHIVDEAGARPYLVPYLVEGATSAVIVLPGGGYEMKADHEGGPIAQWLNEQGISAFVLQYRLTPKHRATPLEDGQSAVRHVRAHAADYGLRPDRIGILGFSAGGHLAAMTGTVYTMQDVLFPDGHTEAVSSRPDLMVLCYPVITMESFGHAGSKLALLGTNASEEQITAHSAERQVTFDTPPAFLWHTADDEAVPVRNSLRMALALEQHSIPFELHIYEHGGHGAGLATGHPAMGSWTERCADWLHRQGW